MSEIIAMTVVTTLGVVMLIVALGMLLQSLARNWQNQLVRECTRQLPTLERSLDALQHDDRQLAEKLDRLAEKSERQAADIRRICDYLLGSSQPQR
jgi:phosphate uptake regulator